MSEAYALLTTEPRQRDASCEGAVETAPSWPLTAAIARGDEQAFAEFYERWFDRVYARARSVTRRDEAFCLDVVQDCMMRVVRGMRPLQTEAAVAAWMARTLFSTAVDRLRQDRRRARREQAVVERDAGLRDHTHHAESLEQAEQSAWLRARIAELPAGDRELILARFESGKTLEAIGAAHGMSVHAAHGRIWRILGRLRKAAKGLFDD